MWHTMAQVPMPESGDDPWVWVAGLAVAALAWITREYLKSRGEEVAEWRGTAKTAVAEMGKNTTALGDVTDGLDHIGSRVETLEQRLARIEARLKPTTAGDPPRGP